MQTNTSPLPTKIQDFYPTLAERFWSKVSKTESCWIWTGGSLESGYGMIRVGGSDKRKLEAHRVSWILENGFIPDGLCVLHKCDNPPCVNPKHLFIGTLQDNVRDMNQKGRSSGGRIPRNQFSRKTSEEDVVEIRELYASGNYTMKQLATRFGYGYRTIRRIIARSILCYKQAVVS